MYAPVVIPTLCRYEHFKRCIESLKDCEGARETELYIGLDYPLKPSHEEGYKNILKYIDAGIDGFKKVHVYEHPHNLGAEGNTEFLREQVYKNHSCSIWTEDDNSFSPNFLLFVNKCLSVYKDDERAFSVSGYAYPIKELSNQNTYYLYPAYSAWGVGIWHDKFKKEYHKFNSLDYSKSVLRSFSKSYSLLKMNPHVLTALISMVVKQQLYGDTIFESIQALEGKYSIFPTLSKSRNYGHDGSGLHCTSDDAQLYLNQEMDSSSSMNIDIAIGKDDKDCIPIIGRFKNVSRARKIKILTKYILYRLGLY